ncbi:MAG TPA: NAD(P)-dependent oxidoreductase [Acidimicrobiales bacterium]|nr:NAD(P)-dependent oxidoreductase [Acidimicrobiales bacterium]
MNSPRSVGFVGLGNMGMPMARRLAEAGNTVVGYDVSEAVRQKAVEAGVGAASDTAQVARGASILILMLPDSNVVEQVLNDHALLEGLSPGTLVVDMSSSEPLRTRELASHLEKRDLRMIDAPVSGGVSGAENGKLTIMVGGDAADLEDARSTLEAFGRVVFAGPIGSGHAVKALNNLLSATHLWITSEAMLAGEQFGIEPDVMLSIFNTSSGRSGSTENKWPNFILPGTFNSGFGLRLMLKDMKIAVQLAEQAGMPSALGAAAVELWGQAAQDLPPTADHTEVARWLHDRTAPRGQ